MSKNIHRFKIIFNTLLRTHLRQNAHVYEMLIPLQRKFLRSPFNIVTGIALFWPLKSDPKPALVEIKSSSIETYLIEADHFFDSEQYQECLDYIKNMNKEFQEDVELLWRKSRVLYQLANQPNIDPKIKTELATEAYDTATLALKTNDNHFAVHKWMSVILDLKSSCDGLSERIKNLENVKNHMLRAIEINPHDATTLYMLGEWCYRIADMPWYQRRIAQTLFATPPTSSFDEAIQYFSRAEVAEPRFYSMNLLMLGKTYLKLGKKDIAEYYLNLALLYPARSNDDHQANKEAQDILKNI